MNGNNKIDLRVQWLHERSRILEKYAVNIPDKTDNISLQLDDPHDGWIDMHMFVNGKEKALINASDVYEPFVDIKEWLESIVSHIFDFTPSAVNIFDESYNYILYYEPLFYQDDELLLRPPSELCGLFYVYDSYEYKIVADAYCKTSEFVRTFYETIVSYAKKNRENELFVTDWIEGAYNKEWGKMDDDDPRIKDIFIMKVSSKLIERFLSNKNGTTRFVQI